MDQKGLFDSDEDLQAYLARLTTPQVPQNMNANFSLAPNLQARLGAQVQPEGAGMPQTVTPSAGLTMGPLSLSGGLQLQQAINDQGSPYTRATPTFGAGLKVPLAGGDASANFNITPDQMKAIDLAYRHKLLGGDLSVGGNYMQPAGGTPQWGANLRYHRSF